MVIAIVTFNLPSPTTLDAARDLFKSTAPKYQSVAGLTQKSYTVAEDGTTAGAIYFWNSKADAEAVYTDAWKVFVTEKYGVEPQIKFMHSPVTVDNVASRIIVDDC